MKTFKNTPFDLDKKKQRGQFLLEYILLAVFVVGIYTLLKNQLGDQNFLSRVFSNSWSSVAKMMEDGSWDASRSTDEIHPLGSNQSREGDTQ